jgi:hypothetical protein
MSNRIWVKWWDPDDGQEQRGKVRDLEADADVDDLLVEFLKQQNLTKIVRQGSVIVCLEEGETKLIEDAPVKQYFIVVAESKDENKKHPGRSLETALFVDLITGTSKTTGELL